MKSRIVAFALLLLGLGGLPASAAVYNVTPTNFVYTMNTAVGGDVINIDPSVDPATLFPIYKAPKTRRVYDPPLVLNLGNQRMSQLALNTDGITINGGIWKDVGAIEGGYALRGTADHLKLIDTVVDGASTAISISGNYIYVHNYDCTRVTRDCLDLPSSSYVHVDGLWCHDAVPGAGSHPDCLQTWAKFGDPPSDNWLVENVHTRGNIQGVANFVHLERTTNGAPTPDQIPRNVIVRNSVFYSTYTVGAAWNYCTDCQIYGNHAFGYPGFEHYIKVTPLNQAEADSLPYFSGVAYDNTGGSLGYKGPAPVWPGFKAAEAPAPWEVQYPPLGTQVLSDRVRNNSLFITVRTGPDLAPLAAGVPFYLGEHGNRHKVVAVDVPTRKLTFDIPFNSYTAEVFTVVAPPAP